MKAIRRWLDSPRCDRDMGLVWLVTLAASIAAHEWVACLASIGAALAHLRAFDVKRELAAAKKPTT